MPRVRYTADGGHYRVAGVGFDPGDEREVDHGLAQYLGERDDFEVLVEKETEVNEADSDDEQADSAEEASDEFDADTFLDRNVDPIAEDIRAGEADEHLDAVGEAAERVTVQDAIGERRAELEG